MRLILLAVCVATLGRRPCADDTAFADDNWPRFRGPNGSGPQRRSRAFPSPGRRPTIAGRSTCRAAGISSPVVWGDRLFVTAADEEKLERSLLCYSTADGKLLWSRSVPFVKEKKHRHNSYATNTPSVDADRVYTLWQGKEASQLVAYDHQGQLALDLRRRAVQSGHGGGISPIVVDGVVALNLNHDGDSCMLGVDAATGKEKWKVPREKVRATYSTPCVYTDAAGRNTLVFTSWQHGFSGRRSAHRQDSVGNCPTSSKPKDAEDKRAIGSPFVAGSMVYGNCGFVGGKKIMAAVKPGTAADGKIPDVAFRSITTSTKCRRASSTTACSLSGATPASSSAPRPTPARRFGPKRIGGNFSSSPICVDGKLYCISDDGEVVVIAASKDFEELGRTTLDEGTAATPAVAGDAMYLRTYSKLLALPATK